MRVKQSGQTNDADIRLAKSIVDYVFRWTGKKFLNPDPQEEIGVLSPEVKARLARRYKDTGTEVRHKHRLQLAASCMRAEGQ